MQFEHKVGTDYVTVNFYSINKLKEESRIKLYEVLNKLGMTFGKGDEIRFPKHITSKVLEEVIRNTCFVCGGLMKDSTAFKNQDIIEIPNGLSMTSHVYSNAGEAKQIKVRKCSSCGHSHT